MNWPNLSAFVFSRPCEARDASDSSETNEFGIALPVEASMTVPSTEYV